MMKLFIVLWLQVLVATPSLSAEDEDAPSIETCFDSKAVRVICEDLSEPAWNIPVRAELVITATDGKKGRHTYAYMRGVEGPLCFSHRRQIKKLLQHSKKTCIVGWGRMEYEKGVFSSHWESLKTENGKVHRNDE